ncbi:MAG: PilZ domain-containing protein [Desulfobacterales bacterium]
MTDFRRRVVNVEQERRHDPRLDFSCPVIINGIKGVHTLGDMSLGGVFIELNPGAAVKIGQKIHLVIKLPTENYSIYVKSEVIFQNPKGIGCQFLDIAENDLERFRRCFEIYRDMLPVK